MTVKGWYGERAMSGQRDSPGQGESDAWSMIATLVAGPAVWGLIGHGVDRLAETSGRPFTAAGVVIGFVASLYVVYVKYGRD